MKLLEIEPILAAIILMTFCFAPFVGAYLSINSENPIYFIISAIVSYLIYKKLNKRKEF
jgi:hypothetical protein